MMYVQNLNRIRTTHSHETATSHFTYLKQKNEEKKINNKITKKRMKNQSRATAESKKKTKRLTH